MNRVEWRYDQRRGVIKAGKQWEDEEEEGEKDKEKVRQLFILAFEYEPAKIERK